MMLTANLLLSVIGIFNTSEVHSSLVREHKAAFDKVLVSGE
jgi:hypothetical protein